MNKVLAILILGMGLTGAILLISIPSLFKSPIGNVPTMITAGSATAFAIFAIRALMLRQRLDKGK